MAVVKADAYGHGMMPIAKALAEVGVDWFGVATVEEGIELRTAGITEPILLLGGIYLSDPADLVEFRLTPAVSSLSSLDAYAACAHRYGRVIEFHLKLNTGMNRLGLPLDGIDAFIERYRQLQGVRLGGVFTHLASAEDLVGSQTDKQLGNFAAGLEQLAKLGVRPDWVHVSNSMALLTGRASAENLVRVGALLYGFHLPLSTQADLQASAIPHFEPILALKSRIVFLKDLPGGTPLGYGATFYTERPSRIATVPIGYADGLPRHLSNRGQAIVRDQFAPIVGAISMDLTLLDVTDIPGAAVGDEVVFIGKTAHCSIAPGDVAGQLGTVPYEVLCSIGKRVPRVYVE